jgi:hypothetical protein
VPSSLPRAKARPGSSLQNGLCLSSLHLPTQTVCTIRTSIFLIRTFSSHSAPTSPHPRSALSTLTTLPEQQVFLAFTFPVILISLQKFQDDFVHDRHIASSNHGLPNGNASILIKNEQDLPPGYIWLGTNFPSIFFSTCLTLCIYFRLVSQTSWKEISLNCRYKQG